MKIRTKAVLITVAAIIIAMSIFSGVFFGRMAVNPEEFKLEITSSGIYLNSLEDRIPQTVVYSLIYNHFYSNNSGKIPMLLFVGYDGCVANAPVYHKDYDTSAIFRVADSGGLYLGYTGGENPGDQSTSTAPGWASAFTGVWGETNGVRTNKDTLNENTRTIMYHLALSHVPVSFSFKWPEHFNRTYKNEAASALQNNYPISYILSKDDQGTYDTMQDNLTNMHTRAVFGIFEYTDSAGHTTGFTVANARYRNAFKQMEDLTYTLLDTIENRVTYGHEDWLIIIMSDHGGKYLLHGGTSVMESTIFYAINKPLLD